jgi:alkanesulfonate monooxygenase SsuD/methylene tetrahydromethanopterin reductase-like flavin-dependent oxidoreductase (luciferase family)
VEITPEELGQGYEQVRQVATESGRAPEEVALACCRPIEVTREPVAQDPRTLRGTPEQLVEALRPYQALGVRHLALQFMAPRWPDRMEQIERFASEVMPHVTGS